MVVDSHCHLHDPAFPDALDALRVALAHDVWGVVAVGCDAEANARELAVSLHPPHGSAVGALEALERHHVERAVFHWHKAPAEVTRRIVDAGYFVSVTPEVVYRERDRALVEQVPLESLLVESDAPWQYDGESAGLQSGPWLAARVAEEVAKLERGPT